MKWHIEVTDTFGGQANYCWVKQFEAEFKNLTFLAIARRVKKRAALNRVKGRSYWHGDMYEFRPYGVPIVLFAWPQD